MTQKMNAPQKKSPKNTSSACKASPKGVPGRQSKTTSAKGPGPRALKVTVRNKKLDASSRRWLERQLNDPFVHQARADGYRSRAAYKFLEIQEKFSLIKKGMCVVDLGAAPGGWSQVAAHILAGTGKLYAIDLLEMEELPGVHVIQGDFMELDNHLEEGVDVILSDMAPNSCGIKSVDHLRLVSMLEDVFAFAKMHLNQEGALVAKVLRGGTESNLLGELKNAFKKVVHFKPESSRKESREIYVIAQGFRLKKEDTAGHTNTI